MRKRRRLFTLVFLLFLLLINEAAADDLHTGFSTEALPEKDRSTFLSNTDLHAVKEAPAQQGIQCFDVSENGMIAIGQNDRDGATLCVYSPDGAFQYGYSFHCKQSFGVEWDGERINICFVRSDVIMAVNREGEVLDIARIQNTIDNNTYWNHMLGSTERVSGDTKYSIRNDMGILNVLAPSYSQLIATKATGEETILYDVNSAQFAKICTVCILAIAFILLAIAVIVWQFVRLNRNTRE